MSHTIVTYTVQPGREEENAALVRAVFEDTSNQRPSNSSFGHPDGSATELGVE